MSGRMKACYMFLLCMLFFMLEGLKAQPVEVPPGVVVAHVFQETGKYIGSPGLCILPDGSYLASHDEFGPKTSEYRSAQTHVFRSADKGRTWKKISQIDGQFWSNLFVLDGTLYIMGTHKHHGNFVVRRSDDGGRTWSNPYNSENGLILEGEYHTAPVPVVIYKGRIWRAVEYATAPSSAWGKRYSPMVVSAPVHSDLLNAKNWRKTNHLMYNPTYLAGNFKAWIEGNVVVSPKGELLNMLRVEGVKGQEYVAMVRVSKNGKKITFNPEKDFIPFPGGSKKFAIRYDEISKRYWTLTNYVKPEYKDKAPGSVRNTLVLCSSIDLNDWTIHKVLLEHPDQKNHGFQYIEWLVEGDDIIFLSRTAFDDEKGGAHNNHDANFLTFHRVENFRSYSKDKFVGSK